MNRKLLYTAFLIAAVFLIASSINAIETLKDDKVHISNLHTIDGDLYAWGETIIIDGTVDGDIAIGGYEVNTNGTIKQSANIFAYNGTIDGYIEGSMRMFAYQASMYGHVGRSAVIMAAILRIDQKAVIERDLIANGGSVMFDGTVNGNARLYGDEIRVSGTINGDLEIKAKKIKIEAPAFIKGNLTYTSAEQAEIDVQSGVTILGETTWNLPDQTDEDGKSDSFFTSFIIEASRLLAAFLFGIILFAIARKYVVETIFQLKTKMGQSFGVGIATISIFIVSIFILLLSLILLIAGGILISEDHSIIGALVLALSTLLLPITSFATVAGGILFYTGKIMLALLIGFLIISKSNPSVVNISKTQLLIGLIILAILFNIPFIGIVAYIVLSVIGAGGIVLGIKHCRHEVKKLGDNAS